MFRNNDKKAKIRMMRLLVAVFFIAGMIRQAHACDESSVNAYDPGKLARQFVLYNYRPLANDILNGGGVYLSGLYGILEIDESIRKSALVDIRGMLISIQRISDFAIELSNQYAPDCPLKKTLPQYQANS